MSFKLRKLIYSVDPNAEIRNAQTSVQGQSFDIKQNPNNSWTWMINPYNDATCTLTNNAFFIFYYQVKLAQGENKNITFANNMIVNGINTFSFSQGEQSVFTMASANIGRSFPLWTTYNKIVDLQQEGVYQTSQIQDSTFISNDFGIGADFGIPLVPTNTSSALQIPIQYNQGRKYVSDTTKEKVYNDCVMVPLCYLAPTSEPLQMAKGILSFVINWGFSPNSYLNLEATQEATNLISFSLLKADFFYTTVKFSAPIPRPVLIKPCRVIVNRLQGGPWTLPIIAGQVNNPLEIQGVSTQLAPGKILKLLLFPQIVSISSELSYVASNPYKYGYILNSVTPNLNSNQKTLSTYTNTQLITGLSSCLSEAFSIQNVLVSIDGGQSYLPSNAPAIYFGNNFGGMPNYIYSLLMGEGYGTTGNDPKAFLSYEFYNKYFQVVSVNCSDTVNFGNNSQVVVKFSIYPTSEYIIPSAEVTSVNVSFECDYFIVSVEN